MFLAKKIWSRANLMNAKSRPGLRVNNFFNDTKKTKKRENEKKTEKKYFKVKNVFVNCCSAFSFVVI